MSRFGHLTKGQKVRADVPQKYTFADLEGSPFVRSLPATEENKAFTNESLKRSAAKPRRRNRTMTTEQIKAARNEDRDILANFCVKGWGQHDDDGNEIELLDAAGNAVPFSAKDCHEFFKELPDHIFDGYRAWATDQGNFLEAGELGEP